MKFRNKGVIAGCASTLFLFGSFADADTVFVTGTYTGTAGTGASGAGAGVSFGNDGADGYDAGPSTSNYVFNANIQGGSGASGSYNYGGAGGFGVTLTSVAAATFNGGTYTGGASGNLGTSSAFISGTGVILSGGPALVTAGTFTGGAPGGDGFDAETGTLTILAGTFTAGAGSSTYLHDAGLEADPGSIANIYGGAFNSASGAGLFDNGATINIFGSNFAINGVPVAYGTTTATSGTLTGLLQDNTAPGSITFAGGSLNLVAPVPEPTSVGILIGGVTLALRRRQRRA